MAVSLDLRQRAVAAYERGDGSIKTIATRFAVGASSLDRWLKRKRDTGSVERAPRAGGRPRGVTPDGEALVRAWLADDPSAAQHVLAARLTGVVPVPQNGSSTRLCSSMPNRST
jgi:transposase